MKRLQQFSGK